jgi:nucleotide-binding universal stress UspA family protein
MFKHILVPTDGSDLSLKAARVAVQLAKSLGARVTAYHAIPPYQLPLADGVYAYVEAYSPEEYKKATESEAGEYLAAVQAEAKNAGVPCTPLFATCGAPWDGIIKAAASAGCDLIVMASHGRKGIAGVLLGSEAQKVLTHSTLPVMVCR